jgi:hypothetical protein
LSSKVKKHLVLEPQHNDGLRTASGKCAFRAASYRCCEVQQSLMKVWWKDFRDALNLDWSWFSNPEGPAC